MLTDQEIDSIRAFNRHYTQVLGVLNKRTFDTNLTWRRTDLNRSSSQPPRYPDGSYPGLAPG